MPSKTKSLILVIDENNLSHVESNESGSFTELKIWERSHIQEWIRKSPEILGEELLILTVEFDKFVESSDRLDILAMDVEGNIVVIELKRDNMAGYADLQAIRYASMISSLTLQTLLPYFVKYLNKHAAEQVFDNEKAENLIREHVNGDFQDFSTRPRIILCSENFSQELTTSVLWLRQFGVDISCVRIKPHKVGERIIVVPTLIIPLPEAKQYQTEIQLKEEAIQNEKTNRTKRATTLNVLINNGQIQIGEKIYLREYLPDYVIGYSSNLDKTFTEAEIYCQYGGTYKVKWLFDNEVYSISGLTKHIFKISHPEQIEPQALTGGLHWQSKDGKNLANWADEIWAKTK